MSISSFSYVIYIRATPDRAWAALLDPEIQKRCWPGLHFATDWKAGAPWRMVFPDGRVANSGEIVEIDEPRRLMLTWRNEIRPERIAEGYSRALLDLEAIANATKLSVTHTLDRPESALIAATAVSWPRILSNLKSVLETGNIALPYE